MSRKKRKRRNAGPKVPITRAHVQGRKIMSTRKVRTLTNGEFVHAGYVYQADDFPPHKSINMETTSVVPLKLYEGKYVKSKHKGKEVMYKVDFVAKLYSNSQECSDVI